jgi:glycosyltransferase involved in cell wall biosynthesis
VPDRDTVVFIPAWNEELSLPGVLAELAAGLPDIDVLVIDDGSTDATAAVASELGAIVVSFGVNRGLRAGIAAGYHEAYERGYAYCGRVDADGQHPVEELRRLGYRIAVDLHTGGGSRPLGPGRSVSNERHRYRGQRQERDCMPRRSHFDGTGVSRTSISSPPSFGARLAHRAARPRYPGVLRLGV